MSKMSINQNRPRLSSLWVLILAGSLSLSLILGTGCGLLGGGEAQDTTKSKVRNKVAGQQGQQPAAAAKPEKKSEDDMLAELEAIQEAKENEFVFERQGKIDPFYPIEAVITTRPEPEGGENLEKLTPLQRLALSQIKLVAVVVVDGPNNRALVEDSTGTGYIIQIGTKIGQRNGVVTEIAAGVVKIKETITDSYTNQTKTLEAELKLSSREGEKK